MRIHRNKLRPWYLLSVRSLVNALRAVHGLNKPLEEVDEDRTLDARRLSRRCRQEDDQIPVLYLEKQAH
jgi:hypothetical protein